MQIFSVTVPDRLRGRFNFCRAGLMGQLSSEFETGRRFASGVAYLGHSLLVQYFPASFPACAFLSQIAQECDLRWGS